MSRLPSRPIQAEIKQGLFHISLFPVEQPSWPGQKFCQHHIILKGPSNPSFLIGNVFSGLSYPRSLVFFQRFETWGTMLYKCLVNWLSKGRAVRFSPFVNVNRSSVSFKCIQEQVLCKCLESWKIKIGLLVGPAVFSLFGLDLRFQTSLDK